MYNMIRRTELVFHINANHQTKLRRPLEVDEPTRTKGRQREKERKAEPDKT